MPTVADFLIDRLKTAGVKHVFGVTGEFVAPLFERIAASDMGLVTTADEAAAGFAADAYARVSGIGCVVATYNVGALKLVNSVACAFAERSPLVVISGAPSTKER